MPNIYPTRRVAPFKKCARCLVEFPRGAFKSKQHKHSLQAVEPYCPPCRRESRTELWRRRQGLTDDEPKFSCACCGLMRYRTAFGKTSKQDVPTNKICLCCIRLSKHVRADGCRLCNDCLTYRDETSFYPNKGSGKLFGKCKTCHGARGHANRQTPQAKRKMRNRRLILTYNLTLDQRDEMERQQNGKCAICIQPPLPRQILVVDHDHTSGEVRGLLCEHCNKSLGLMKEDINRFLAAIRYLTKKPVQMRLVS